MQTYFNKWECSYQKRAQVICLVCVGWIHCQWACCQFTITVLFPPWFYTYLLLATLAQNRIYPSIFRVFTDILTRFHSRTWSGTRQSVCITEGLIPKEVGLVYSGWRCVPIHLLPIIHPLGAHCQLGFLFDFIQLPQSLAHYPCTCERIRTFFPAVVCLRRQAGNSSTLAGYPCTKPENNKCATMWVPMDFHAVINKLHNIECLSNVYLISLILESI